MKKLRCQIEELPNASVLDYCRELIKSQSPKTKLEVYRGDKLCMTIKSIGEGAKLTVQENSKLGPRFVKYRPFPDARTVFLGQPVERT